eukprot:CAMPEP_0206595686 /NCGR_PEP_ID=MMETSP0325_2-20121206/43127_1 /ASSEMBLY_ACC=CAM_ASM_000347 /TAXON_ID=2866 /ORGANISM="Crypthecodinium cohnii, Strain Seligo" /LENGTH=80 /DNA_ID=CAMNT_0054106405 /DNA_START=68 /DNA_END=307 /DNA_ORIENTATION=+
MSLIGQDQESAAGRRSRMGLVAASLIGAVALVVVVATVGMGAEPSSLATFRRHALERETVQLIGQSAAIDGFNCFLDTTQ